MDIVRQIKILARKACQKILAEELHTQMPAQVVSYDGATNTCSIQPCVNRMRSADPDNMETVQLPQIDDVPVHFPGSGKLLLSVAPQVDSYGIFHVSEREIETWMTKGGAVDPNGSKKFDISDGFFSPGAYPLVADGDNGKISPAIRTDRIELRTRLGTTFVAVTDAGDVEISAAGNVIFNSGSDFAIQYTAMKSAFDALKSELNALVTAYNAHIHITTATIGVGGPGVIAPTTSQGVPPVADMSGSKVDTVNLP